MLNCMRKTRSQTLWMLGNAVAFQLGWFACVLAAARGQDRTGVSAALIIVAVHLALATRPWNELQVIGATVAAGWSVILPLQLHLAQRLDLTDPGTPGVPADV